MLQILNFKGILINDEYILCFILYECVIYLLTLKVLIRGIRESNMQNPIDLGLDWKSFRLDKDWDFSNMIVKDLLGF